ncbi:hypothetical protein C8R43DRAFT_906013 [Mycena crocata]|nr:hypothetical protein C8R43DRAFT_906013 [Mycena crocata]
MQDPEEEVVFVGPEPILSLTKGFSFFTDPGKRAIIGPAPLPKIGRNGGDVLKTISLGSSAHGSGTAEVRAGAGVWYGADDPENMSIAIPTELDQTLPNAEVIAALHAIQSYSTNTELRLESGKNHVLRAVTKNLPGWDDKGWMNTPYKEQTMALISAIRSRTAKTMFAVVKDSDGVREAVALARDTSKSNEHDYVDLQMQPESTLYGAKLSTLTQAMAYKAIKELRDHVHRKTTDENVLAVQKAVKAAYGKTPTVVAIWKSIHNKDISRQVRNFLWKTLHGVNRVGYWHHIPELEAREKCHVCEVEESLEHILFDCTTSGQSEAWELAEELWLLKHNTWPTLSMGSALTSAEIKNRWVALLNEKLNIDRALTNRIKFGRQHAVDPQLLLDTWKGSLYKEEELPDNWLRAPEVLVGVVSRRSQRSPSPPVSRDLWPD